MLGIGIRDAKEEVNSPSTSHSQITDTMKSTSQTLVLLLALASTASFAQTPPTPPTNPPNRPTTTVTPATPATPAVPGDRGPATPAVPADPARPTTPPGAGGPGELGPGPRMPNENASDTAKAVLTVIQKFDAKRDQAIAERKALIDKLAAAKTETERQAILTQLRAETQTEREQQTMLGKQIREELKKLREQRRGGS